MELDLRILDEGRCVEAPRSFFQGNGQPYSHHDWPRRLRVAKNFGHAAAAETAHRALRVFDELGIDGELALREEGSERVEIMQTWRRPDSARNEPPVDAVATMARVAVLCPDLLFGSKVEGALRAAGHAVDRVDDEPGAWATVLVDSLRSDGALGGVATVGFYPHVERETRERAEAVGFDLVVPRSRMAREAGALLERALASAAEAPGPHLGK
jgi:hypothetical protein